MPSARVRASESGELEVSGPLLFDGYFDDPDATAAALVDGWYRTGDLVKTDSQPCRCGRVEMALVGGI